MMKLSRFTQIGMAVLAAILVVWLVLTLASSGGQKKSGPSLIVDDKHCPICGQELPKGGSARDCPYCLLESKKEGGKPYAGKSTGPNPVVPIVLGVLFVLLIGANIFVNVRSRWKERQDETYYLFQCVKCSRRIRYRQSQFGKPALCPLCKRPFVFPRPDDAHLSPWLKMKRWLKLAPR
jgi:hypothetical protein